MAKDEYLEIQDLDATPEADKVSMALIYVTTLFFLAPFFLSARSLNLLPFYPLSFQAFPFNLVCSGSVGQFPAHMRAQRVLVLAVVGIRSYPLCFLPFKSLLFQFLPLGL